MERSERNLPIKRLIATSDCRGKSPHVKKLILLEDLSIYKTEAAEAVSLSRKSIHRALQAKEEGRGLGRNRTPSIFN